MFINYAHRGASEYAPENTLCSFYLGILQGANGIETDVRMTKDNVLILFHDNTLDRVTTGSGNVSDYTYDELLKLNVVGGKDKAICDKIVSFEDFLRYFSFRDIAFAIELKQSNIEKETIDMIEKFNMCEKVILTSFDFENIRRAKMYCPKYKVGYLTSIVNDNTIEMMKEIIGEEICPKAEIITKDMVEFLHHLNFSVRAWNIADPEIMANVYELGVNGMTVNFPDLLVDYIKTNLLDNKAFE